MGKITVIVPATELSPTMAHSLPGGAVPGMRYRVTIEEPGQNAKLAALRAHVAKGLAEAESGHLLDESEMFDALQRKYPDPDA